MRDLEEKKSCMKCHQLLRLGSAFFFLHQPRNATNIPPPLRISTRTYTGSHWVCVHFTASVFWRPCLRNLHPWPYKTHFNSLYFRQWQHTQIIMWTNSQHYYTWLLLLHNISGRLVTKTCHHQSPQDAHNTTKHNKFITTSNSLTQKTIHCYANEILPLLSHRNTKTHQQDTDVSKEAATT